MASLSFSLSPHALIRLHNALTCLYKFNESVSIEAEHDLLRLSVLNSTKSAYSAFSFAAKEFFEDYSFRLDREYATARGAKSDRFSFRMYLKALLSVFKGRASEKDKDTAVERCEVELHEGPEQTECRLVVRRLCGLGVVKSYKLTYEPASAQHAVFDRSRAINQWAIEPKFLREIIDHFNPSAEQLDICSDGNGKTVFTSFTTKVTDGRDILKQPVHTSVAIDWKDFEDFLVEDNMHVAINAKDFKAIVLHAETLNATITARYTRPCRPLQLAYETDGINAEFTLMTRGEGDSNEPAPSSSRNVVRESSARQASAQPARVSQATSNNNADVPAANREMPPPRSRVIRPLMGTPAATAEASSGRLSAEPRRTSASADFDGLFVPADDDRQWDEPNDETETAEDTLGWDATTDQETFNANFGPRLQNGHRPDRQGENGQEPETVTVAGDDNDDHAGIPPTQRISQLHGLGLFD